MLQNRREFTGLGVALSSFMALLGASAIDAASGATSSSAERTVGFRDGTVVPVLGQGSARLALGRHPKDVEEEALRTGISLGMTLIDTSDDYSGGRSEKALTGSVSSTCSTPSVASTAIFCPFNSSAMAASGLLRIVLQPATSRACPQFRCVTRNR